MELIFQQHALIMTKMIISVEFHASLASWRTVDTVDYLPMSMIDRFHVVHGNNAVTAA